MDWIDWMMLVVYGMTCVNVGYIIRAKIALEKTRKEITQLNNEGLSMMIDARETLEVAKVKFAAMKEAFVLWDNGGGAPDVESTAAFFFLPGSRNYNGDKELSDFVRKARVEFDTAKREEIYKRLFDKVTAERYAMPVMPLGSVIGRPAPIAAAIGSSMSSTLRAPADSADS